MKTLRCFAVLTTAVALGLSALGAQSFQVDRSNRLISVTATDSASRDADLAIVHIGFQTFGPDEQSTYATGSKISNAIVAAVEKSGVEKKSIESESQNLAPFQDYHNNAIQAERAGRQFVLNQSWTVKTTPENAAGVLNAAVAAGANQSGQIDWQLNNPKALDAEAAAHAIARARAIAAQMAQGMNVKLGQLIFASNVADEGANQPPRPLMMMKQGAAPRAAAPPLAIRSRQIEQTATVRAVFAIE